jgi:hypothetical protein
VDASSSPISPRSSSSRRAKEVCSCRHGGDAGRREQGGERHGGGARRRGNGGGGGGREGREIEKQTRTKDAVGLAAACGCPLRNDFGGIFVKQRGPICR